MGLRDLAGDMARSTAGVWRGIAEALDPQDSPHSTDRSGPLDASAASTEPIDDGSSDLHETDGAGEATGGMLVPIDTWTRILEQLGHLHEAGQDLADARERAAKAETENRFLREQIADLRRRGELPAEGGSTRSAQALWARRPWSRDPADTGPDGG